MIGKYGPVIAYKEGDNLKFKSVKKDIDIEKLKRGEYKLKDIVQIAYKKNVLGRYKNKEVILKNGKYGLYVTVDGKNMSIKTDKSEDEITLEDEDALPCNASCSIQRRRRIQSKTKAH